MSYKTVIRLLWVVRNPANDFPARLLGLGLAACQRGMSVGFTTAAAPVHELMEARDEGVC